MLELKAFVTNLGKYNEGELVGEWVTFPIDEDEQNDLFMNIGLRYTDEEGEEHNQEYEEYFITDYDCEFNSDFLGEYESIETLNEYAEKIAEFTEYECDEDLFKACLEVWDMDDVLNSGCNYFWLNSNITSDYDLGYYYAYEAGCLDIPEYLESYIDFESYGRDIRFESDGAFTDYGWVERVN